MDDDLIRRARAGDAQAREDLILVLRERLEGQARGLLGEGLGARYRISDIVQSTCLEVCQRVQDFEGEGLDDVHRWARLLLANNIRRKARRHGARKRGGGVLATPLVEVAAREARTPSLQALGRERCEQLLEVIETIAPEDRALLHAALFGQVTTRELAARHGFRESTLRSRLARARARLLLEARRRGILDSEESR